MLRRIFALTLVAAAAALFWFAGQSANAAPPVQTPVGDPTHGEYIFSLAGGCGCHMGPAGFLAGGTEYTGPFGKVYSRNITSDVETGIGSWTEQELVDTLRTGHTPDGRQLFPIMPYMALSGLTDQDAHDLAAFIKTVPPISHEVPKAELNFPVPPFSAPHPDSVPADGVERGKYIVNVESHCSDCHTPQLAEGGPDMAKYLAGGPIEGEISANITPDMETGIGSWSEQDIVNLLHTGKRPDGTEVHGLMMLVLQGGLNKITDSDAMSVAQYLKSIPAVNNNPYAQLPSTGGVMYDMPLLIGLALAGGVLLLGGVFVFRKTRK